MAKSLWVARPTPKAVACLGRQCQAWLSQWRNGIIDENILRVSEEVREAVNAKRPVVALETTIYTHGWSYPDNLTLATDLESAIRAHGGVPATIGVLDGIARVGMTANELQALVERPRLRKISRRDFGFALGLGVASKAVSGGTTVAGTMILANLAGISVFATGGLGGVHKGGESSLDISADLTELGRTPVAVISSGCKGFLDVPRTLEYLETQGVAVATFADGRTGEVDFPSFWSRDSGVRSPFVLEDEVAAARAIRKDAQFSLPLSSGLLLANPIAGEFSIPRQDLERAFDEALQSAPGGSENTPFVLNKMKTLTAGQSVTANRALIGSNVIRGTKVAVELSRLQQTQKSYVDEPNKVPPYILSSLQSTFSSPPVPAKQNAEQSDQKTSVSAPDIIIAGGLAVDLSCDYVCLPDAERTTSPQLHTSNPAAIRSSIGGVAHNVAKAAHSLGSTVQLCSVVGDDLSGRAALASIRHEGLDASDVIVLPGGRTAQYVSVNDQQKNLVLAMADMTILENANEKALVRWTKTVSRRQPQWLVVDANWSATSLQYWLRTGKAAGVPVAFEPVSAPKSIRLFSLQDSNTLAVFPNADVALATPNSIELAAMYAKARNSGLFDRQDWWTIIDSLGISSAGARAELAQTTSPKLVDEGIPQQSIQLLPFMPTILTKLGARGVLLTMLLPPGDSRLGSGNTARYIISRAKPGSLSVGGLYMRLFPPAEVVSQEDVVSVNGVGDTFLGALMAGLTCGNDAKVEDLVDVAQRASVLTLKSREAVAHDLKDLRKSFEDDRLLASP